MNEMRPVNGIDTLILYNMVSFSDIKENKGLYEYTVGDVDGYTETNQFNTKEEASDDRRRGTDAIFKKD